MLRNRGHLAARLRHRDRRSEQVVGALLASAAGADEGVDRVELEVDVLDGGGVFFDSVGVSVEKGRGLEGDGTLVAPIWAASGASARYLLCVPGVPKTMPAATSSFAASFARG